VSTARAGRDPGVAARTGASRSPALRHRVAATATPAPLARVATAGRVRLRPRACSARETDHRCSCRGPRTRRGHRAGSRAQRPQGAGAARVACTAIAPPYGGGATTGARHQPTAITSGPVATGPRRQETTAETQAKHPRAGVVYPLTTGGLPRHSSQCGSGGHSGTWGSSLRLHGHAVA